MNCIKYPTNIIVCGKKIKINKSLNTCKKTLYENGLKSATSIFIFSSYPPQTPLAKTNNNWMKKTGNKTSIKSEEMCKNCIKYHCLVQN